MIISSSSWREWREAFCPSCQREITPETPDSVVTAAFARLSRVIRALITFGVPVPPGTKPRDFFQFIGQQGFLRVWLNRETSGPTRDTMSSGFPAIVPVIQDRLQISAETVLA